MHLKVHSSLSKIYSHIGIPKSKKKKKNFGTKTNLTPRNEVMPSFRACKQIGKIVKFLF